MRLSGGLQKYINWLLNSPIRHKSGALSAWVCGSRPSYRYEESTCYLLIFLCYLYHITEEQRYFDEAKKTVGALVRMLANKEGCGRKGRIYLFDTAICVRALKIFYNATRTQDKSADKSLEGLIVKMERTAQNMLANKVACVSKANKRILPKWSTIYNAHIIKAIASLVSCAPQTIDLTSAYSEIDSLIKERFRDGFFFTDGKQSTVYIHAHCYAVEGLIMLEPRLRNQFKNYILSSADRLAEIQTKDGAICNWFPISISSKPVADASAQAVRIWQCTDSKRFAKNIKKGLDFLKSMTANKGGVQYSLDVDHLNSWATIFTAQAMLWQNISPDKGWLV